MRAIRTARSVTHDAIVRVTKAAPNVLEEFERTALIGNPMYNRVYLRLFMRGYAEVIGIRPDDVLRAADEMLQGQYTDRLARLYLESHEPEAPKAGLPSDTNVSKTERAETNGKGAGHVDAKADDPDKGATVPAVPPGKSSSKPPSGSKTQPKTQQKTQQKTQPALPSKPSSPPNPISPHPTKPALAAPPRPAPSSSVSGGSKSSLPSGATAGIAALLAVTVVALAIWFFWPDTVETTPALTEELTTEPAPVPAPQLPPRIVLGDTTSFFVIAARDTLNPIRITPDGGIRAPHWIELGDSMEFRVANELVLEMRLNAVDVSVHDVLLPTTGRDAARRLVLTKAFAQAYLDSLRTAAGALGTEAANE